MKWLLTLIIGALLGAAGLFIYLRQVPHDTAAQVVTPGATALPPPAAVPGPNSAAVINGQLPPAPVVEPDLTAADLPLRPTEPVPVPALVTSSSDVPAGKLMVPVDGIKYSQLTDNYNAPRGTERHHEALDIMAPKGTKVFAVADGKVAKLFTSVPGGLTLYQFRAEREVRLLLRAPGQIRRWHQGRPEPQARRSARLCRHDRQCRSQGAPSPLRRRAADARKNSGGRARRSIRIP